MNKAPEYRVGVGAASILMIFIILSLTTLGVLTFASSRADWTLTNRRKDQVISYYEAVSFADELIAQIDAALYEARQEDPAGYEARVQALEGLDSRISVSEDAGQVFFEIPVGSSQALQITLSIHDAESPARYTVLGHNLVNTAQWVPDETINLLTDPDAAPTPDPDHDPDKPAELLLLP